MKKLNLNEEIKVTEYVSTGEKKPLIIGDIHGMKGALEKLLIEEVGCRIENNKFVSDKYELFTVGDLIDRGEDSVGVIQYSLKSVIGNHDWKGLRFLLGNDVQIDEGFTFANEADNLSEEAKQNIIDYYLSCPMQIVINEKYIVVHGAMRDKDIDGKLKKVHFSNLYGCPSGEKDEEGLPVRNTAWRDEYTLPYKVIYGHTPLSETDDSGNTINIDTGAAFGNKLTAYSPEENIFYQVNTQEMTQEKNKRKL